MKRIISFLLLASLAFGQTANVTKSLATATLNQVSGDLTFGSGKTLTMASGSTLSAASLTSPAGTNLTLGLGTGGTALTLTSSTLAATFAGSLTLGGTTLTFPAGSGVAPYIQHGSNALDIKGGTSAFRVLNNAGTVANLTIADSAAATFAGSITAAGLNLNAISNSPFTNSAWVKAAASTGIFLISSDTTRWAGLKADGNFDANGNANIGGSLTVGGAVRMSNYGAGAATFDSSGNITSVSDARLKNITGTFTKGLAEIVKLTPKLYTWKPETGLVTDDINATLIAQDLIAAGIPEAVTTYRTVAVMENDVQSAEDIAAGKPVTQHAKLDADGKPVTQRVDANYSVSDRTVIAALVNAVKELKAEIDTLKAAK